MLNQLLNIYQLQLVVGLDIVKLGEDRQAVISRLSEPNSSEDKKYYKTDFYDSRELRLEYNYDTLKCESIQIYPPAKVMYGGINLMALKYDEALQWVHSLDSNVEEAENAYGSEFIAHTIQIAMNSKLYAEGVLEGIFVFIEGYWPPLEEREAASQQRLDAIISKYKPGEAEAELERMMNQPTELWP